MAPRNRGSKSSGSRSDNGDSHPFESQTRRLPFYVSWSITLTTAVLMALANFVTICLVSRLVDWKFETLQHWVDTKGVKIGLLVLIGVAVCFSTVCALLIAIVSPAAGSSGAPENKAWLNGSPMPGFFTVKNLLVRATAVILANASGYPLGREGPSVTMGSNIAFLVAKAIGSPYLSACVDVDVSGRHSKVLVDEDRLSQAQRVAGSVGGACAMAMIFDAPIGGILYMLEEITVASWPLELTFRAFAGTMVCTMLSYCLLELMGTSLRAFVIYEWNPQKYVWSFRDVPAFVLIAIILGPLSAFHTKAALAVAAARQRIHSSMQRWQPFVKMFDTVFYAALCAAVCGLVSLLAKCDPEYRDEPELAVSYVRYNCEEGAYNPVASMLLTTSEGAVKRLFSRKNSGDLYAINSLLAFVAYTFINIGLTGISVPSGNFTGTMLIGGLVGRFVGSLVRKSTVEGLAATGVYAMVGSAAMLCGFKQISMAVVVFIVEAGCDVSLAPPLMLSVTISLALNRVFIHRGFDEEQIARKELSFLPGDAPDGLDKVSAIDLCDTLHDSAVLSYEAPLKAVRAALDLKDARDFPVVDRRGRCTGFTTRARLEAAVDGNEDKSETERLLKPHSNEDVISVASLADPLSYMILENASATSFYPMFAKCGANVACVVNQLGEFRGIITRKALAAAVREAEEAEEDGSESEENGEDE